MLVTTPCSSSSVTVTVGSPDGTVRFRPDTVPSSAFAAKVPPTRSTATVCCVVVVACVVVVGVVDGAITASGVALLLSVRCFTGCDVGRLLLLRVFVRAWSGRLRLLLVLVICSFVAVFVTRRSSPVRCRSRHDGLSGVTARLLLLLSMVRCRRRTVVTVSRLYGRRVAYGGVVRPGRTRHGHRRSARGRAYGRASRASRASGVKCLVVG